MKLKRFNENFEELGIVKDEMTIDFLNRLLSNHFVLFLKMWNFHWNVTGPKFDSVHKYLNELYDKFFEDIDEIAERVRTLNGRPIGTIKEYLQTTELEEFSDDKEIPNPEEMYEIVLRDYEFLIREIRNFLSTENLDNGTINFLEDMITKKEKDAWMIRSHIE